ncbi:DUF3052 domain-containing protein [Subtercola sp. PAMC28395]|uniref:DUF3052 domain-containing protein n=1 Tax=Subtercola sp. PAMC28395 TaxID=2846775 RepID=UPI001C0D1274|nr:DUF3052 domain-containing protein [Subtercola sp. PAMC28395]QWT23850.1 DUF3052 domain-containing protein [Subtercola sp. PAMC28395]
MNADDAPSAQAGYSSTPQARKLGLKPAMRVCLDEAPPGWMLDSPPPDIHIVHLADVHLADVHPADVHPPELPELVVAFFRRAEELAERLPSLSASIFPTGALWIAWPRKAAGHISDLGDSVIRETALSFGIVDVKVAALDSDWSALKFVWRVENRVS